MKVELHNSDLLLVPETDFESSFLHQLCPRGESRNFEGFLKTGLDFNHVIGLKLMNRPTEAETFTNS